ncbi:7,8-didemethyl-8-hydroxy-5-deazariboflavin synthase subunit CofG [Halorhabdus rudnickae]|uniref:7,8-didemethyl-8-hydroxy-5-deazariboflavin synthase subunit CofG n=1 Tax=Halorhabdus rudnickae TaxID=1775544 RepID=UPI001082C0A7|nr:7,8-didemethyl-8-hydroxy-5-deazariboflavin synthase subunit CofG [Halorhabdus rudnickae]
MIPGAEAYDVEIEIDPVERERLLSVTPADVPEPTDLSFSRNVFVPLTTACRYTCTYCTYYDPPGEASLLSPESVREICQDGAAAGCTEALFTFGDDPDDRYDGIDAQLAAWGHDSIHTYLREVCEIALEEGLLPHANPGDQTREQMAAVADVNASMGVMLETTADVVAHSGSRRKEPGQRLATIRTAGELGVPFTTGILVGIGEDFEDRAESILAIRDLHDRYGHVQEVIVQPVSPNERWNRDPPSLETMRRTVAMARAGLPAEIAVQVPPNLARTRELLDCGVDDLGGVSPVTDDHVNPDYAWPALEELRAIAAKARVPLQERLPVYERYVDEAWLGEPVLAAIRAEGQAGERFRAVRSE